MECNRDEAIRAKTIAEKKLSDKDFVGAKKFALKAKTLYPELDGISQMFTILDLYISAENKINGESDWYGILGVNPSDDDETIRKKYRKLALMLHPDKNKSVGADGAFKLLSEAWSLLSDKSKRLAYNQRRSAKIFHQKIPNPSQTVNAFHNSTNHATNTNPKSRRTITTPQAGPAPSRAPDPPPVSRRSDTFWTVCHRCKMHYEYLNVYLNHTLLCPNCQQPFLAKSTVPPHKFSKPAQEQVNHGPFTGKEPFYNKTDSSTASRAANVIKRVNDRLKKENLIASKVVELNKDYKNSSIASKVVQTANERLRKEREDLSTGLPSKNRKFDLGNDPYRFKTGFYSATRELTPHELQNMLIQKARKEICKKLNEWKKSEATMEENNKLSPEKPSENGNETEHHDQEEEEPAMSVPDPDFHDFDSDRTEDSFQENQVWSAYDDDDGMPRFYIWIHKVISRNPLKMKISWLNSKTTSEFGDLDWIGSGFKKTCGEFRLGKHEIYKSLNSFSQKVYCAKNKRGSVVIYPKKGEVWALYRNWSRNWIEEVSDDVIHQYEMVEIVDDYDEEQGVTVSYLVKYTGFKTVFHPITNQSQSKKIPKEEMFRFSHQVPKYVLTGTEARNSPKGCLELDPAATSLELIHK